MWRWLWQFWCDMQKTQQHVLSAKLRCGGRNLVSLRLHLFLGPSVSPPWVTPPGFTARWSSALNSLSDWLTSVRRVNWYISAELIISSNSMGDFRIPSTSLCSLLGHPTPIGHSLFPFWFGWHHCFPFHCPNKCRNFFHLSHFNIIANSSSKYSSHINYQVIKFHYCTEKLRFWISPFSNGHAVHNAASVDDVGVSSSPIVAGVLLGTTYGTSNSKQIWRLVLVPVLRYSIPERQTRAGYGSKSEPYTLTQAYRVNFKESPSIVH